MLISRDNLVTTSMDGREYRGRPGNVTTAEAQFSVINGLLECYQAFGNPGDLSSAIRLTRAAMNAIFEKRATSDSLSQIATAVTADTVKSTDIVKMTATATAGLIILNAVTRKVLRTLSAGTTLKWTHPYANIVTGQEYTVSKWWVQSNQTRIQLVDTITGPVDVLIAVENSLDISGLIEVQPWTNLTQIPAIDTWTASELYQSCFTTLRRMSTITGDVQWQTLADIIFENLIDDMSAFSHRVIAQPTWADDPLAVNGRTFTTNRVPAPTLAVDNKGGFSVSAPRSTSGNLIEISFGSAAPITLVSADVISVNAKANVPTAAVLELENAIGTKFTANITIANQGAQQVPVSAFTPTGLVGTGIVTGRLRVTGTTPLVFSVYEIHAIGGVAQLSLLPFQMRDRNGVATWQGALPTAAQPIAEFKTRSLDVSAIEAAIRASWDGETFRPWLYPPRQDAITYGTAGLYGYKGPNDYRHNGDLQYRTLSDILQLDAVAGTISEPADDFTNWLSADDTWLPMYAPFSDSWVDLINSCTALAPSGSLLDTLPALGPPTDYTATAAPQIEYPDPYMSAQILESVVDTDMMTRLNWAGPMPVYLSALTSKAVAALDNLHVSEGDMAGTFSPDPEVPLWHGHWHGEITRILSKVWTWAKKANIPTLTERCENWITGLNVFLERNRELPHSDLFAENAFDFAPNWSQPLVETFTFSTKLIKSRSGVEQRISNRVEARRRLEFYCTAHDMSPAELEAQFADSQNRIQLVPDWHTTSFSPNAVSEGDVEVFGPDVPAYATSGSYLLLSDGDKSETVRIAYRLESRIFTVDPIKRSYGTACRITPLNGATMAAGISRQALTSSAVTMSVIAEFLPQFDNRTLPDRPDTGLDLIIRSANWWASFINSCAALMPIKTSMPEPGRFDVPPMHFALNGQDLEVLERKPNWRQAIAVASTWSVDTVSQDDGPIYVTPKTSRPERAQDLLWTIYTSDDLIDALSFIKRSQGAQKPFWSPTFMADLTLSAAQVGSQQLDVLAGRMVDSQLLLRPDAAIAVQRPGETMQLAAVTGISTLSASVRRLTLDRQVFNGLSLPATTKISLVYRTRFTGDSFSIQYLTGKLVELKINVTTAQVLTNGS